MKRNETILESLNEYKKSEKPAVICGDRTINYGELVRSAGQIAMALKERGVQSGDRVLVCLRPGIEFIVSMLGILYAGAVYVPVDTEWPEERISHIFSDCNAVFAVTEYSFKALINSECTQELPHPRPEDPFAVYYTSGSTGMPKGALTTHAAVANVSFAYPDNNVVRYTAYYCRAILSIVNCAYGFSRFDYFCALSNCMTLVIASDEERQTAEKLADLIARSGADAMSATPSMLLRYMENDDFRSALHKMKRLLLSGESLSTETAEKISECTGARIYNGYGATEMVHLADCEYRHGPMDLGNPVHGCSFHILRDDMTDAEAGEPGELYTGGVSAGSAHYVNRPDFDAEKYIEHPVYGRLFKTGDRAFYDESGRIWLRGRTDGVIKLRGQRIDPLDIEGVMEEYTGIRSAAVKIQGENAAASLSAYYTSDETVDEGGLRRYLADRLPYYMVPSYIRRLDDMPMNLNGKLSRSDLPDIDISISDAEYEAPATEKENILAEIFEKILDTDRAVGRSDSFFELGGDSVTALRTIAELRERGFELKPAWMFAVPVISDLAGMMQPVLSSETGSEINYENVSELNSEPDCGKYECPLNDEDRKIIYSRIPEDEISDIYPMHSQMEAVYRNKDGRNSFNVYKVMCFAYDGDVRLLKERYNMLVEMHQSLRSVIVSASDSRPFIVVLKKAKERLFYADIRSLSPDNRGLLSRRQMDHINKIRELYAEKGWPEAESTHHAGILRIKDDRYVLILMGSHFIFDISIERIVNELLDPGIRVKPDDEIIRSFYDANSHRNVKEAEAYWKELTKGAGGPVSLASDKNNPLSNERKVTVCYLDAAETNAVIKYCRRSRMSLPALLNQGIGTVLNDELDQDAVSYFVIRNGRGSEGAFDSNTVGMFSIHTPFVYRRGDTAAECQQQLIESEKYEHFDFNLLGDDYCSARLQDDVMVVDIIQDNANYPEYVKDITLLLDRDVRGHMHAARRIFVLAYNTSDIRISFIYDTGLYDTDRMERIADSLRQQLLSAAGIE